MTDILTIAIAVLWITVASLFVLVGYQFGAEVTKTEISDCLDRQEQFYTSAMKIVEEKSHTHFREDAIKESTHILTSCLKEVVE